MTGDIEDIVESADDPEVAVVIPTCAVSGEVEALFFVLVPVGFDEAFVIAPEGAQHGRPWFADDEFAAFVGRGFIACFIDDGGVDSEAGKCRGAGFRRRGTWER